MANLLSQNEVDVLMKAISTGQVPAGARAKNAKKDPSTQNVRVYDFKHPVMFLKDQLRTLQNIHETFARTLSNTMSSYLRTTVKMNCIGVDQISYGEYVMSLPEPCTIVNTRFHPSEGRTLMAIHPSVGLGVVDRVTGGAGISQNVDVAFTEIEQAIIDEVIVMALRDLEVAWNRILKVMFTTEKVEFSAQFVQLANQEDTVVAVTTEVNFGNVQGILSICYPSRTLNPIVERLNAKHWIAEEQKMQAAKSRGSIHASLVQIPLRMSAHLGTTHITMQDLLQIKQGDVLVLDRSIDQSVELELAGIPRFTGRLGASHGKTAMLIESRVEN